MPEPQEEHLLKAIIFPEAKKVGCVLLQALVGGDSAVCNLFETDAWEVTTLDGAKPVAGTQDQWERLAKKWNTFHKEKKQCLSL